AWSRGERGQRRARATHGAGRARASPASRACAALSQSVPAARGPRATTRSMAGTVVITGAGGLIGSESARHFAELGHTVVGIDNDMRASFFGPAASTRRVTQSLSEEYEAFENLPIDIRDGEAVTTVFRGRRDIELVVHAAAQPSHDWAARDSP